MAEAKKKNGLSALPAATVRQLDTKTIDELGIPGLILMENAGQEAARLAARMMRTRGLKAALLLAGRGNNGGDAFVVARHLANEGFEATICLAFPSEEYPAESDAGLNLGFARISDVPVVPWGSERAMESLSGTNGPLLLVDGLLGTGIKGAPRSPIAEIIESANSSGHPILALDLPSGLDADSGASHGHTIRATETVTFGVCKSGLIAEQAAPYVGTLHLARISIPKRLIDDAIKHHKPGQGS